jgi:hypothetical protein
MDIVVWLGSLGLGKYEAVFRKNDTLFISDIGTRRLNAVNSYSSQRSPNGYGHRGRPSCSWRAQCLVEIGGSGNWPLSGDSSFGPTAGVEFEPIKNSLEIEVGTCPMFGSSTREWDTDILFKKPFTLSDKVEFMIGAGPQWGTAFGGATKAGVEIATSQSRTGARRNCRRAGNGVASLASCQSDVPNILLIIFSGSPMPSAGVSWT